MGIGILAGVVIGAVIGYFTNYIAVRMLFRPHRQVRIGVMTVPFTPGIIPRRQPQLARALGRAVGDRLFTKDDLKGMLASDEVRDAVVGGLMERMKESEKGGGTLKETILEFVPEYLYADSKESIENTLVTVVRDGLLGLDIGNLIFEEGSRVVKEKFSDSMMGMFINDSLIASMAEPVGAYVEKYIEERGEAVIRPFVEEQVRQAEGSTVSSLMQAAAVSDGMLKSILGQVYAKVMDGGLDTLLEKLDICETVEEKVNMMNPADIEELVLSVMKNELNAVVRLGAVIGAVIGLLNGLF